MARPTKPIEPSFKEFKEMCDPQVAILQASLKAKYGIDMSNEEALQYLNYCHHLFMARVMFSATASEEMTKNLLWILKDVGADASKRLAAQYTGQFPAPASDEDHWESPQALEEALTRGCTDPNCTTCRPQSQQQPPSMANVEPSRPSERLPDGSFLSNGYL